MNIAYVMRYWPVYGGGETITVTLSNAFVKKGHRVCILYQIENTVEMSPYTLDERIKSIKLHTQDKFTNNDVESIHKVIIENNIDVMIVQWANTKLCDMARKGTNTKLIACWHMNILRDEYPTSQKGKILNAVIGRNLYQKYRHSVQMKWHKENYFHSDLYVFLSNSFMEDYINKAKQQPVRSRLNAISNPLTYDYLYDLKEFKNKKKEILFVGRVYEYHKRVSYILRIWKEIEQRETFNEWRLRIVGDGPDMQSTKQLAKNLSLQRISFEGFTNPRSYFFDASIFLMTSAFEGFGMALVEAQQYGVVPIAMDTYLSLRDIIHDGENGIIVADNDFDNYVKKLCQLMANYDMRKRMAKAGLKSCQRFSIDNIIGQWEELFKTLRIE